MDRNDYIYILENSWRQITIGDNSNKSLRMSRIIHTNKRRKSFVQSCHMLEICNIGVCYVAGSITGVGMEQNPMISHWGYS